MLKETNGLNVRALRPSGGRLRNYSLCRSFDRLQRLLGRVFRHATRNVSPILAGVHICKCRQPSTKDSDYGTKNRSRNFLSSVSLRQMGTSTHPFP